MWGRIVRAHDVRSASMQGFEVGIDDEHIAILAVQILRPELTDCRWDGGERLTPTAIAYLELLSGEVRAQAGHWPGVPR